MTASDDLWERMTGVFREFFEEDSLELARETTADDVEDWDSVTTIELMVALEIAFGIRFKTGEMAALENVGQLADRIRAHLDG